MGNKYGCKSNKLWVGKKIVQEGITHAPDLYKYGTSKIKNKKIQHALNSDIANYDVAETQNKAKNHLNDLFRDV